MASELKISYNGTATIYCIIRRDSDDYVWNGSAFALWADGFIGTYDIPLTSVGGDTYSGDFPTAITTAANYWIYYYRQNGASPAITDLLLKVRKVFWDGAISTSTGSVSLSPYALCTLEEYKRGTGEDLNSTTDDDLMRACINAATSIIEKLTNRQYIARDYIEWISAAEELIVLKHRPVITVYRIATGQANALQVNYSGSAIRALVGVTSTKVQLQTWDSSGTKTTTDLPVATYKTHSTLATAISNISGWTATDVSTNNGLTVELRPMSPANAKTNTVFLTYADGDNDEFFVKEDTSILGINYTNLVFDIYPMMVSYRAGYEVGTVPDALKQLCIDTAALYFDYINVSPTVQKESLGDYSIAYADGGGFVSALTDVDIVRIRQVGGGDFAIGSL
jgi:hypothetical protein